MDRRQGRPLIQGRRAPQVARRRIPELLHQLRAPPRLHQAQPLLRPGPLRQRPERRTPLALRRLPGQIQRHRLLELSLRGRAPTPRRVAQPLPTQHRQTQHLRQITASRRKRSNWAQIEAANGAWWPFNNPPRCTDAVAAILESETCILGPAQAADGEPASALRTRSLRWPSLTGILLDGKPRFHPTLLTLGIMRHVGVTHSRQFTGGIFAGVSMSAGAVGDDFNIFVGQ